MKVEDFCYGFTLPFLCETTVRLKAALSLPPSVCPVTDTAVM